MLALAYGLLSYTNYLLLVSVARLGDDGGQAICRALLKNNTLTHVHLGSNDLGEPTAAILSQVFIKFLGSFKASNHGFSHHAGLL